MIRPSHRLGEQLLVHLGEAIAPSGALELVRLDDGLELRRRGTSQVLKFDHDLELLSLISAVAGIWDANVVPGRIS